MTDEEDARRRARKYYERLRADPAKMEKRRAKNRRWWAESGWWRTRSADPDFMEARRALHRAYRRTMREQARA